MPAHSRRRPADGGAATQSQTLPDLSGLALTNSIRLLSIAGSGTYGAVYHAVDTLHAPGKQYAVKCQWKASAKHIRLQQLAEITLHELASDRSHPGVVTTHGHIFHNDFVFIVMDFCPDGDLFGMLTGANPFIDGEPELIRRSMLQLIDALDYLHTLGIFHRDLKPENILIRGGQLMITDFGLATANESGKEYACGSSFYMSPECVGDVFGRTEPFVYRLSDIWSLGVIFVNIVFARNPWEIASQEDPQFRQFMSEPAYLLHYFPMSPEFGAVLQTIFTLNPRERVTLPELRRAILQVEEFITPPPTSVVPPRSAFNSIVPAYDMVSAVALHKAAPSQDEETVTARELLAQTSIPSSNLHTRGTIAIWAAAVEGGAESFNSPPPESDIEHEDADDDDEIITPEFAAVPDNAQIWNELDVDAIDIGGASIVRQPVAAAKAAVHPQAKQPATAAAAATTQRKDTSFANRLGPTAFVGVFKRARRQLRLANGRQLVQ